MAIEWAKSFEINIAEIDSQHRELFKRVNNFVEATSEGEGKMN